MAIPRRMFCSWRHCNYKLHHKTQCSSSLAICHPYLEKPNIHEKVNWDDESLTTAKFSFWRQWRFWATTRTATQEKKRLAEPHILWDSLHHFCSYFARVLDHFCSSHITFSLTPNFPSLWKDCFKCIALKLVVEFQEQGLRLKWDIFVGSGIMGDELFLWEKWLWNTISSFKF